MQIPSVVALVGKVGHGKTCLLNKVTGRRLPSHAGAKSCTRTLQFGYTRHEKITVVDTPGFYASDDVAAHIAAQKLALEGTPLSAIYAVVKYARADDIAEILDKVLSFVGEDNSEYVRVIITHCDLARDQEGYNQREMQLLLSKNLDMPSSRIAFVGTDTTPEEIEYFMLSTLLEPKAFTISDEQVASISSLCVGTRKFNKAINEVYGKIAAASKECQSLVEDGGKSYETDVAITTIQNSTSSMVELAKTQVFQDAEDQDLSAELKNLVYGKAGFALSLRLKAFMEASNKFLSWDVTDVLDQRNIYRQCHNCGAVYNKTEGCDGATTCGAVPKDKKKASPRLQAQFKALEQGWTVQYCRSGVEIPHVISWLREFYMIHGSRDWGGGHDHCKKEGAVFESGCGAAIEWKTMRPIDPALIVECLGTVEIQHPGKLEGGMKSRFESSLRYHEAQNRKILQGMTIGTTIGR
jgi:GTP-binding protein EngB required for normal cell division